MIGQNVGNYVVREKIGQGGMGAVYLAEHRRLGRRVAVKVLLPHMVSSPEMAKRFFNEAKAATDIHNEHIVDVLDFGDLPDGSSYIVMEWLEGQSLQQLLSREPRLPMARVAHIAQGIARALGAAHAHGIVHRDLKPDNIFLVRHDDDADFVKILDFGIAKLTPEATDVRTQAGAILGTPYYMSPEQCNGGSVDRRTDVYAMGVILYQMLTGRLPFSAQKLTELLVAHATQPPPPLRTIDPSIPPTVESAVLQALEKDPERRFNTVEALARAFAGEVLAPPPPVTPSRKLPLYAVLGGVVALGIAAVVLSRPAGAPNVSYGGNWVLQKTDCPPGAMPPLVESTQVGSTFTNRAAGFPESVGTLEPDGHFKLRNALGSCSGKLSDRTVTETCTNKMRMSCHATYQRVD